jgi:hypothetical protein
VTARVLTVAALALVALAWRLVNAEAMYAPNLELVTAVTVAAALLLPRSVSWSVPLLLVAVSDKLIGSTGILVFTWSAWAVTILASALLGRLRGRGPVVLGSTVFGVGSSTWFFLWTNFGVWVLGAGVFYPATWAGLVACYTAGVPFYRTMLLGNLVLVPLTAVAAVAVRERSRAPGHGAVPLSPSRIARTASTQLATDALSVRTTGTSKRRASSRYRSR